MNATATLNGVITFGEGLPGFEAVRRFVLVTSSSLAPFTIVQGVEAGGPSFIAIDPHRVTGDFGTVLAQPDLVRLGVQAGEPLLWLALVTARPDQVPTVNLRAPLVINPVSMRGIQVIPPESPYLVDYPLPPV
jgi:flagellar assembly factor FliW